jgi:hypothetical protein
MFVRSLTLAAVLATVLVSAGCSCCHHKTVASAPPCCGAPGIAVPAAVPAAPLPVQSSFAPGPSCPNCVGR